MKVAIVGVTGLVGQVVLKVLEEFKIQIDTLIPVASERSKGKKVAFGDNEYSVVDLDQAIKLNPNIAIFSAGGSVSLKWAPKFAEIGCFVVDNSSAWRMNPNHKLIVPEINANKLTSQDLIIANPNCSTIQLVMAIAPIHRKYGIKRMIVSTYQSFTGTGSIAVQQYESERDKKDNNQPNAYPHPIFENAIPHCDIFLDNKYTKEEVKVVNESRKILGDESLNVTCTAVRIPVFGGHSESVNLELKSDFNENDLVQLLNNTPGVEVMDNIESNIYPTPLYAHGKNEVFVGRIRRDYSIDKALNLWIVSDNLRKGAATNAVQIVKYLIDNDFIKK